MTITLNFGISTSAGAYTLGIFTDIQYANKPDREVNFLQRKQIRCYSRTLSKVEQAVAHFNDRNVAHVLHLGDIIDGNDTPARTVEDLQKVMTTLSALEAPLHHVIGNHCLEIGRKKLHELLRIPPEFSSYHRHIDLTPTWRILLIDTMACSMHGSATEPLFEAAAAHLKRHADEPNSNFYSGGLGAPQIAWLRAELERGRADNVNIIVVGHHPVSDAAAPPEHVVWHAKTLLKLLSEFKDTVRAVFSGHYHHGGYAVVDGIHHVVFESILDSVSESGSHGLVFLFKDRIEIEGKGDMSSRILKFHTA